MLPNIKSYSRLLLLFLLLLFLLLLPAPSQRAAMECPSGWQEDCLSREGYWVFDPNTCNCFCSPPSYYCGPTEAFNVVTCKCEPGQNFQCPELEDALCVERGGTYNYRDCRCE